MSVKSIVFLAIMVFAIMASGANLPRAAAEKAVIGSPRGLGNQGFFGKIVARQETITVTATADSCSPPDPVTSVSSQVPEIQSTESPVPVPVTTSSSSMAVPSASETPEASVDPLATSSMAVSSTPPASRVTPSASSPVSSETATPPPIETNLAVRNGGLEGAILVGAAGFAALAAL
ncbi:hypothetical protein GX50_01627 [[Emmonsia] crescens]|uniref:Uncharacterized protein n=1 Tax=[Emmonsia] crescens TaxID=73230 RepID=A0A2B7ZPF3_9EURO|nr:hypothetical protein GX50_01627 [Emmonsia crescens]